MTQAVRLPLQKRPSPSALSRLQLPEPLPSLSLLSLFPQFRFPAPPLLPSPLQYLKNMYAPRQLQHIRAQCVRAGLLPATHAAVTASGLPAALQRRLNGWASKQRKSASDPGDQALLDAASAKNAVAVAWIVASNRQMLGLSSAAGEERSMTQEWLSEQGNYRTLLSYYRWQLEATLTYSASGATKPTLFKHQAPNAKTTGSSRRLDCSDPLSTSSPSAQAAGYSRANITLLAS